MAMTLLYKRTRAAALSVINCSARIPHAFPGIHNGVMTKGTKYCI